MSEKKSKIQELLNRKRKNAANAECDAPSGSDHPPPMDKREDQIEQDSVSVEKAKRALIFEAKRGKDRSDSYGPQGWIRPKSLATNKNFLRRTLVSTLPREKRKNNEKQ